jgi:hypothetical protein
MAAARGVSSSGDRPGSLLQHWGTDADHPINEDRRQILGAGETETGKQQNKESNHPQSILHNSGLGTGDDFLEFLQHLDLRLLVAELFSYRGQSVKNFLRTFENIARSSVSRGGFPRTPRVFGPR